MSQVSSSSIFYAQLGFSLIGITLASVMIIMNTDNSDVFLPILTSLLFSWVPSPMAPPDLNSHLEALTKLANIKNSSLTEPLLPNKGVSEVSEVSEHIV